MLLGLLLLWLPLLFSMLLCWFNSIFLIPFCKYACACTYFALLFLSFPRRTRRPKRLRRWTLQIFVICLYPCGARRRRGARPDKWHALHTSRRWNGKRDAALYLCNDTSVCVGEVHFGRGRAGHRDAAKASTGYVKATGLKTNVTIRIVLTLVSAVRLR